MTKNAQQQQQCIAVFNFAGQYFITNFTNIFSNVQLLPLLELQTKH